MEKLSDSSISGTDINQTQKISLREKLVYGTGDVACNIVWASTTSLLLFFYTDVAGIPAVAAGIILLLARFLDVVVSVVVGLLVDKTKTRFGKARPWLLWMAVPFGVVTVLLFTVPNIDTTGKIAYAAITYLLLNIIYTCISVPYMTLNSMITQDQYQRSVLNIFRMVGSSLISLVITTCTMGFVSDFGGGASGWHKLYIVYATIAVVLFLFVFSFTKERVKSADVKKQNQKVPVGIALKALFHNKYLWLIVVVITIRTIDMTFIQSFTVYYADYVLRNAKLVSVLMLALVSPCLIGLLFVAPFIKKFGKRNCALAGIFIVVVSCAVTAFFTTNLTVVIICTVLKGLGFAPLMAAENGLIFDTIEYGEWKTNVRTEGLVSSMGSVSTKIGTGLAGGVSGLILAAGKYVPNKLIQSASALFAIKACYIYLPAILGLAAIIGYWLYKLDKSYPKIMRELHERNQKNA